MCRRGPNVAVVDHLSEFDLEREDLAAAFDDQVHFAIAAPGPKVRDLRFGCLGVYAYAQGDQLSKSAPRRVPSRGVGGSCWAWVQQRVGVDAQQARGERGIGRVVLGW